MKYEYRGRNIEISDQLKQMSEKKLNRCLSKFFTDDTLVHITYRAENKEVAAEITIPVQSAAPIRAEAKNIDKFTALDEAIDKLERQIVRYRKKLSDKAKEDRHLKNVFPEAAEEAAEGELQIRRVKKISAKPMDVDEACLEMELLDHDFFVFRNKDTGLVSVVYKRKEAGTYGLIETDG